MNKQELQDRTKQFALRIIRLSQALPKSMAGQVLGSQLLRAGTSVRANYRSACRARSKAEFLAKLGIVEEEADESGYWMELIIESGLKKIALVEPLLAEADALTAIMAASRKTTRRNLARQPNTVNRKSKTANRK